MVRIIEVTGLLKSVKSERKSEPQQKALREGANPIPPHTRACAERHPPSHARTAKKLSHTLETLKLTRVAWSDSANFRQLSKTGCSRVSRGDRRPTRARRATRLIVKTWSTRAGTGRRKGSHRILPPFSRTSGRGSRHRPHRRRERCVGTFSR